MSGRGLEAISSNGDISATERPISVKFVLMTSVEGGVHVWVVHLSISLNIHNLKGLSHFVENLACGHSKSTTLGPVIFILGW